MFNWEERERIWDKARKLAESPEYITNKNNPLRELAKLNARPPQYDYNMSTLERDMEQREAPVGGKIYAALMDNMRYGGSE